MRSIRQIVNAPKVNMGGIILDQALPFRGIDQIDPFLLVHHWKRTHKGGQLQKDMGVGPHPHRGFAPVTLIFEGAVHHQDSRGNNSIIEAGGTQWMNSGMGIVHSERPSKAIAQNGGDFEIIQFWVNTPAKHKMDPPSYQPLTMEETPFIMSLDKKIKAFIVAGELEGVTARIKTYSPLLILHFDIDKGGQMELPIPEDYNAFLYQLDGNLQLNKEKKTTGKDLTWFENDGKSIHIEGVEKTRAILLAGQPIGEEVTTYGPFVMNKQTEIMEAMRDYQMGKMGVLIETFD